MIVGSKQQLSDQQRLILTALARCQLTATPQNLARQADLLALSWWGRNPQHSWQGVSRTLASLVRRGLATQRSLPKQTSYKITEAGKEACRP